MAETMSLPIGFWPLTARRSHDYRHRVWVGALGGAVRLSRTRRSARRCLSWKKQWQQRTEKTWPTGTCTTKWRKSAAISRRWVDERHDRKRDSPGRADSRRWLALSDQLACGRWMGIHLSRPSASFYHYYLPWALGFVSGREAVWMQRLTSSSVDVVTRKSSQNGCREKSWN